LQHGAVLRNTKGHISIFGKSPGQPRIPHMRFILPQRTAFKHIKMGDCSILVYILRIQNTVAIQIFTCIQFSIAVGIFSVAPVRVETVAVRVLTVAWTLASLFPFFLYILLYISVGWWLDNSQSARNPKSKPSADGSHAFTRPFVNSWVPITDRSFN